HEVVHARHAKWRAAEEYGGIAEQTAQPRVACAGPNLGVERSAHETPELRQPSEHVALQERLNRVEGVVEKVCQREVVGRFGRVEVALESMARCRIEGCHRGPSRLATRGKIERD